MGAFKIVAINEGLPTLFSRVLSLNGLKEG